MSRPRIADRRPAPTPTTQAEPKKSVHWKRKSSSSEAAPVLAQRSVLWPVAGRARESERYPVASPDWSTTSPQRIRNSGEYPVESFVISASEPLKLRDLIEVGIMRVEQQVMPDRNGGDQAICWWYGYSFPSQASENMCSLGEVGWFF